MKTLVTGSHGFIGKHVSEAFIGPRLDTKINAYYRMGNLHLLRKYADECDQVIHLAAYVSAPESINAPQRYWQNNVGGLQNLIDYCPRPTFFASSAAVYKPLNPYALTKVVGEEMLSHHPHATIGRFFNVFGEGDMKGVIFIFIYRILMNQMITVYGDGSQTRCFIYVKDLVDMICFDRSTYDIAYNESITILDLAKLLMTMIGKEVPIFRESRRQGDPMSSQAQCKYTPSIGLIKGLERTIKWVRDVYIPSGVRMNL